MISVASARQQGSLTFEPQQQLVPQNRLAQYRAELCGLVRANGLRRRNDRMLRVPSRKRRISPMQKSIVFTITTAVVVATSIGCMSKRTDPPTAAEITTETQNAQKVAERFANLLISKCGDRYMFAHYPDSYTNEISVRAVAQNIGAEEHFYGYEWRGHVVISPEASRQGDAYEIYRRSGKWFFRAGSEKDDIPIETLQPVKPKCPVMATDLPGSGKDLPRGVLRRGVLTAKVGKTLAAADINPMERKCSAGSPCWYIVTLTPPFDRDIAVYWPSDESKLPREDMCIEANVVMATGMRQDGGLSDPMHYVPQMLWYRSASKCGDDR